jgi:uncharacterized protein YdeI (YjbR/CyaY-like superfamily)
MLSKRVIARSGYGLAEMAIVRFNIESPDAVAIPDVLQVALNARPQATASWNRLTPGKQRGLAHQISSAKRPVTIAKRLTQVLAVLEETTR